MNQYKKNLNFLLVDGYNIIHSWKELRSLCDVSLETARQALMDMLSNYCGFKDIIIIIVFDAYLVKGNIETLKKYNNIYIVFTKEAETADHYIERVVNSLPKNYSVRVATSDILEQLIIMGSGAIRVSAKELYNEIKYNEKILNKKYINKRPIKNNMFIDNLSDDIREWMEMMRRQK